MARSWDVSTLRYPASCGAGTDDLPERRIHTEAGGAAAPAPAASPPVPSITCGRASPSTSTPAVTWPLFSSRAIPLSAWWASPPKPDVIAGQPQIAWNGALRFVKGTNARNAGYDLNGNMTSRMEQGKAYLLTYDAENRLSTVSGSATESDVYDGNGNRVKATVSGVSTVYVGQYYEKNLSTSVITKYYNLSGKRVAMRVSSTVYLLLTDHLGSSNVTYNISTSTATTQRYYPWGTIRPGPNNALPTDCTFTGQKLDSATGLMVYGARWVDPVLGRFVQADTIVPEPGEPQGLNRHMVGRDNRLNGRPRVPGKLGQHEVDEDGSRIPDPWGDGDRRGFA
jgi:RHS repeat-associated protein